MFGRFGHQNSWVPQHVKLNDLNLRLRDAFPDMEEVTVSATGLGLLGR